MNEQQNHKQTSNGRGEVCLFSSLFPVCSSSQQASLEIRIMNSMGLRPDPGSSGVLLTFNKLTSRPYKSNFSEWLCCITLKLCLCLMTDCGCTSVFYLFFFLTLKKTSDICNQIERGQWRQCCHLLVITTNSAYNERWHTKQFVFLQQKTFK